MNVLLRLCGLVSFFGGMIGGAYIAAVDFAGPAISYFLEAFTSASVDEGAGV